MGVLSSAPIDVHKAPAETGRALETLLVQKMLESSGAFKGSGEAGSQLHNDLFVETLAEAVSKSGALGLSQQLERELGKRVPGAAAGAPELRAGALETHLALSPPGLAAAAPPAAPEGKGQKPDPASEKCARALNAYRGRVEETGGRKP